MQLRGAGVLRRALRQGQHVMRLREALLHRLPPSWSDYRYVRHETVRDYFARHGHRRSAGRYETVHAPAVARNPLPCNVASADQLPDDRGWWGYSFRDVPARESGETFIATLPDCRVVSYRDEARQHDCYPAILTADGRALQMRELRFRPRHAQALRDGGAPVRLERATWILERVYHNHSHWLTAHLPKLLLLRDRGALGDVLLPEERTSAMDESLRLVGLDPRDFATFDGSRPLRVQSLTVLGTDRFRPELLQLVPQAFGVPRRARPQRRVFISRAQASRRRLLNEEEVWAAVRPAGFERVRMEALSFAEQVALMRDTSVLLAPHGAGLTNMLFCPPGATIIEIADLSFPNPNFYALASALGHRYCVISADSSGDAAPIDKHLFVQVARVREVVDRQAGHEVGV